ncbi:MAG: isoprenylcysteine carboxylmethyltransferase family protein [Planctomycetota bacterium]|nr:isoprenylcysteine carboxylmethyltransferase family protein [Planctomycetota bacterium]MDA0933409.1 isoprenylcysteine carboxylmethyltransferase family protein [Planctomycetota bacterium]MDA1221284.1 isoprenylcysteine carboxylmethyltransferase family protein [Planctomycetota bacterium]
MIPYRERVARTRSRAGHLAATAVQIVGFWGLFLVVLPRAIAHVELDVLGWQPLDLGPTPRVGGWTLLGTASAIGLHGAWLFAVHGQGTPLPFDTTRRLVVAGVYAHLRNPMAVAGLAQGLAVSCLLGSRLGVAYVLAGAVAWNQIARPLEERALLERFGASYDAYRSAVPCWWPRLRPYRPDESSRSDGRLGYRAGSSGPQA